MKQNTDFKKALALISRTALGEDVELATLIEILCEAYRAEKNALPKAPGPPKVGGFVVYWDPKKGLQTASVLEALVLEGHPFGVLKLRVHLTAKPDEDVANVHYSEKPAVNHWSYRSRSGR